MEQSKPIVEDCDVWWFREIYSVLCAFADAPSNSIKRIGNGQISVPDDQANELDNFLQCIRGKYPQLKDSRLVRVATEIDYVLTSRSAGHAAFDETFWTNDGFRNHPDWLAIRELSREFLIQ